MDVSNNQSEVARLRQQIADEYIAAQRALNGLAFGTSKHQYITARMERMHVCHSALKDIVGEHEATRMMNDTLADL